MKMGGLRGLAPTAEARTSARERKNDTHKYALTITIYEILCNIYA